MSSSWAQPFASTPLPQEKQRNWLQQATWQHRESPNNIHGKAQVDTPPSVKQKLGQHWAGLLLKHNWGCCSRCRQGFPGAGIPHTAHTTLCSIYTRVVYTHCPKPPLLLAYLQSLTSPTQQLLHPGLLPFLNLCEWVNEWVATSTIREEFKRKMT